MISKYSNFTDNSNSSSSSIITDNHNFHHMNTLPNSDINHIYSSHQNIYYNSPYIPYPTYQSNLGFIGNQIISPSYYPLNKISYNNNKRNNFIQGQPIAVHDDLKKKCCGNNGCNSYINDILYLLREMKGLKLDEKAKDEEEEESEDSEDISKKVGKKKKKKKNKKDKKRQKEEEKKRKLQTLKWWKLARDFVNICSYYYVVKRYSMYYTPIRNNLIELRTHSIEEEISLLEEWVITLEEPCWEEFEVFIEENCAFYKDDSKNKIRRASLKIIGVIKKYVEYIIAGSSKLDKIPERIQQIIYEYIKDGAYFPKKYLTTYQICRLNFEFYGTTKNLTDEQCGMIVGFLLLSVVASQKILCNIRESVKQFRDYANIIISTKYVAAVLHFLVKETFKEDVESSDDILSLFNYYRNYHLENEFIEKKEIKDISKEDYSFEGLPNADEDEYGKFFIGQDDIEIFFSTNSSFVEAFKNYVFIWAIKLAKLIREKFTKKDPTLLPRKPLEKPPDKKYNPEEEKKRKKEKEANERKQKEMEEKEKEEQNQEVDKKEKKKKKKKKKTIKKVKTTNENGEEKYEVEIEEKYEELYEDQKKEKEGQKEEQYEEQKGEQYEEQIEEKIEEKIKKQK